MPKSDQPIDFTAIAAEMHDDPTYQDMMLRLMRTVQVEIDGVDGALIHSPASDAHLSTLRQFGLPVLYESLVEENPSTSPDQLMAEAMDAALQMAFDHGFRAGRIFHAEGGELPL